MIGWTDEFADIAEDHVGSVHLMLIEATSHTNCTQNLASSLFPTIPIEMFLYIVSLAKGRPMLVMQAHLDYVNGVYWSGTDIEFKWDPTYQCSLPPDAAAAT